MLCQLKDPHIQTLCPNHVPYKTKQLTFADGKTSDHVNPYSSKLNILQLQYVCKHEVAKIVFWFLRDNLFSTPQHLFFKTSKISSCNTRSSVNIYNLHKSEKPLSGNKKVLSIKE